MKAITRYHASLIALHWVIAVLVCHHSFYLLILLITATGAATAVVSNLAAIVFLGSIDPMPSSSMPYPAFAAHALLATALAILIIVHVLAAVYHQMIRKDGLFRRVSFNGMSQRLERHHPAG